MRPPTSRIAPVALVSMLVLAGVAIRQAAADPSERSDGSRVLHGLPVVLGGAAYLVLEFPLKDRITPDRCRWCESNGFDTAVRSALRWNNVRAANALSNITGYLGNPIYGSGLLLIATDDAITGRHYYDNTVPVLQSAIVTGLINQTLKVVFVRKRPFAAFGAQHVRPANDINTSFFSGHTALAFTLATSSGTVASMRGYGSAPAVWIGGLTLATATMYLRVAGDAHYATDVLTGAIVGSAIGIAIPRLFHHEPLTDEAAPMERRASSAGSRRVADDRPFILSFGGGF